MLDTIAPPVVTCEAVLSEACFLLSRFDGGVDALLALVAADIVRVEFQIGVQIAAVRQLARRYADVPMSFADACLVRMTEIELRLRLVVPVIAPRQRRLRLVVPRITYPPIHRP